MRILSGIILGFMISGCGSLSNDDNSPAANQFSHTASTGCIQGVVVDGVTGKRLNLNVEGEEGQQSGVMMLVRNQLIKASPMTGEEDSELAGEYSLCGFPTEEMWPVIAELPGYEFFETRVNVSSTVAQRTGASEQNDIARTHPTNLVDITLFPKGSKSQNVLFEVKDSSGTAVKDAMVHLFATQANELTNTGSASPTIRTIPQEIKTNANGEALFKGNGLVLGGFYTYKIISPEGATSGNLFVKMSGSRAALSDGLDAQKISVVVN